MPNRNKQISCTECGHTVRSDNLARHMRTHQSSQKIIHDSQPAISNDKIQISSDSLSTIGKYAWKDSRVNRNHHFLFPRNIRAIVCGKSGVGKTCLVTYLLLKPDTLDYNKLIICGKSLHQPEYKIMKAAFSHGWSKVK